MIFRAQSFTDVLMVPKGMFYNPFNKLLFIWGNFLMQRCVPHWLGVFFGNTCFQGMSMSQEHDGQKTGLGRVRASWEGWYVEAAGAPFSVRLCPPGWGWEELLHQIQSLG